MIDYVTATEIAQTMPSATAEWSAQHIEGKDESARNLRGYLQAVPLFAGAIYTPIVHPWLSAAMMLLGLAACGRPVYMEMRCQH